MHFFLLLLLLLCLLLTTSRDHLRKAAGWSHLTAVIKKDSTAWLTIKRNNMPLLVMIHGFSSRPPINIIFGLILTPCLVCVVEVQGTWYNTLFYVSRIYFKDFLLYTDPSWKSLCDPQYATLNAAGKDFCATYTWNRQTIGCSFSSLSCGRKSQKWQQFLNKSKPIHLTHNIETLSLTYFNCSDNSQFYIQGWIPTPIASQLCVT